VRAFTITAPNTAEVRDLAMPKPDTGEAEVAAILARPKTSGELKRLIRPNVD
jgi:hypothetical protein